MIRYFDTSSLAKRYVLEVGSDWVRTVTQFNSYDEIYIAEITPVEMASAFRRKLNNHEVSPDDFDTLLRVFAQHHRNQYLTIEINRPILEEAFDLVVQHGLRAYDAVQLATALMLDQASVRIGDGPILFVTSDHELEAVAIASGLQTDNPRRHP
jgi:uncharacterized protein